MKKRAESRKGMIVLTVAFPPELHRKLAHLSVDEHVSMNELIRQSVREFLARRKKGAAR